MSKEALKSATAVLNSELKLKPTALTVFRELAWRHYMRRAKRQSMQALANDLGKDYRNINRAFHELLDLKVIELMPEPGRQRRTSYLYRFPAGFDEPGSADEYAAGLAFMRHRTAKSVAKSPHLMRPNGAAKAKTRGPALTDTEVLTRHDFSDDDLARFDGHNDEGWRDKMNGGAS